MFLSNPAKSQSGRNGQKIACFYSTSTLKLNFRQKLSHSWWLEANKTKLVHGCVYAYVRKQQKYSRDKALRNVCGLCFGAWWHQQEDEDKRHVRNCGPRRCHFTDTPDSPSPKPTHPHTPTHKYITAAEPFGRGGEKGHCSHFLSVITINHSTRVSRN